MKQFTTVPSIDDLKAFAEKYSWLNQMSRGNGLDSLDNFAGEGVDHAVVVVGRNRDSEILDISNFESALDMLGGESETVRVAHFGHWLCGWIELLIIEPTDEKALRIAYDIKRSLNEYPVLDDSDFSDRECEAYSEFAKDNQKDLAMDIAHHFAIDTTQPDTLKALEAVAYDLNMEAQFNSGGDGCVDMNKYREPDDGDVRQFRSALRDIQSNRRFDEDSLEQALIDYLLACLDIVDGE